MRGLEKRRGDQEGGGCRVGGTSVRYAVGRVAWCCHASCWRCLKSGQDECSGACAHLDVLIWQRIESAAHAWSRCGQRGTGMAGSGCLGGSGGQGLEGKCPGLVTCVAAESAGFVSERVRCVGWITW